MAAAKEKANKHEYTGKPSELLKGSHTSADVVPVRIIRSKFLVNTGLDSVNPLRDDELVVVLEDIGVSGDELGGRNVAHRDSSLCLVSHFLIKQNKNRSHVKRNSNKNIPDNVLLPTFYILIG